MKIKISLRGGAQEYEARALFTAAAIAALAIPALVRPLILFEQKLSPPTARSFRP